MPWVLDAELNMEEQKRFLEPARVQLMVCGVEIHVRACIRDSEIEEWLAWIVLGVAG